MPLSVQQTGEALQEFPPTPMTEMGLQLTPTRAVMGPSTIPSKLRRRLTNGSSCYAKWWSLVLELDAKVDMVHTCKVCWQHWTGPVLHWSCLASIIPEGVATARRGRAKRKKRITVYAARANILRNWEVGRRDWVVERLGELFHWGFGLVGQGFKYLFFTSLVGRAFYKGSCPENKPDWSGLPCPCCRIEKRSHVTMDSMPGEIRFNFSWFSAGKDFVSPP